jgi:hypothetical protein
MAGAGAIIEAEVSAWPEVTAHPHRMGGMEYRVGKIEIGHVHGDILADLPFPKKVRDELIASDRATPHHALPDSGWVSYRIAGDGDAEAVIYLFRINYERVIGRRSRRE